MDRPDPVDARLTELEIKASLAEDTVDRLNEVVVAQQAAAVDSAGAGSRNTGMPSSVWKCSQATPVGSCTQCFSLRA